MKGQTPPAPIRGSTKRSGGQEEGEQNEDQEDDRHVDVLDLLPRVDIR